MELSFLFPIFPIFPIPIPFVLLYRLSPSCPQLMRRDNQIMEPVAPHEAIGTQVMQNVSKGDAPEDREMGNAVDIARIERVYRYVCL